MKSLISDKKVLFSLPLLSLALILIFSLSALAANYDFNVTTDKTNYSEHSAVRIHLKNTGAKPMNLKHMWWMVESREGGAGREVYTGEPKKPPGTPDTLNPGEVAKWSWNMRDNEGSYQPAGTYRIKVHIDLPQMNYNQTKVSSGFKIGGGSAGGGGTAKIKIISDRNSYTKGSIVTFRIKNNGTKELDTSRVTWIIYRSESSGPVACSTHNSRPAGIPDPMPVGYNGSWSWDMRNNSGNLVSPGSFELEVKLLDEGIEGNCFFRVTP